MEQSTNNFQYRPLVTNPQELRLVLIQPGSFSSPIRCSLQDVFLHDKPQFEALSYVWGNAKDVVRILLNGREFNVTANLGSALQHLRLEDAPRVFWIDAICINQRDVEERSGQVRLMGDIYKAAARTTVWLGPEAGNSALAFEYMIEQAEMSYQQELGTFIWQLLEARLLLTGKFLDIKSTLLSGIEKGLNVKLERNFLDEFDRSHDTGALQDEGLTQQAGLNRLLHDREAELEKLDTLTQEIDQMCIYFKGELGKSNARLKAIREELNEGGSKHARASQRGLTRPRSQLLLEGPLHSLQQALESESVLLVNNATDHDKQTLSPITIFKSQQISAPNVPLHASVFDKGISVPDVVEGLSQQTEQKVTDAFVDILWRPWWKRVWVLQEIASPAEVVFQSGSCLATWNELHSAVNDTVSSLLSVTFTSVLNVLNVRKSFESIRLDPATQTPNSFLNVLQRFRYCEATDPLDKVYALLRLADAAWIGDFEIDYDKTPEELYTYVVQFCMERERSLDILDYVLPLEEKGLQILPSWVPDWSVATRCFPFHHMKATYNQRGNLYCASGDSFVSAHPSPNIKELLLKGFVFDAISTICDVATDFLGRLGPTIFSKPQQHLTIIQKWEDTALEFSEFGDPYSSYCTRLEAFWRTIIADVVGDARATTDAVHMFNVWSGRAVGLADADFFTEPFVGAVQRASNHRKLCISCRGYMLLAPAETQLGDTICVLEGGQMPFVLREHGGHFLFIGACYVHGIMDGQAWEQTQTKEFEMRDFALR